MMGQKVVTVKCIGIGATPFPLCDTNTEKLLPGETYTVLDHKVVCGFPLWELDKGVGWAPATWIERPVFA